MTDSIRELVRRSLAGDQAAMAELVDCFRGQVFGLCFRMLGQRQDAEDMTQETFVRALRNLASWDSRREFRPWLLAIAGNRCRTLLAVRRKRPQTTETVEQAPDPRPDMQSATNLAEEVDRALLQLRSEYRQAFLLYHQQQLSYAEIGAALDCPVGTVKTWVHRARRELAEMLIKRGVVQESIDAMRRV